MWLVTAIAESFGTSDQWPPIARLTRPSCASWFNPRSLPSPGAAANTSVNRLGTCRLEEPPLERGDQFVGRPATDKSRNRDRVAIANDGDRLVRRHDLVLHLKRL